MYFDEETKIVDDDESHDDAALLGSRGGDYEGGSSLLYDQFELVSTVAKKHQIILLKVSYIYYTIVDNFFKCMIA